MAPRAPGYLVVGIDIGMTQTGVAYSWNGKELQVVQSWPGGPERLQSEKDDKVPTILTYKNGDKRGRTEIEQWGFGCSLRSARVEWFKRFLDPKVLRQHNIDKRYANRPKEVLASEDIERFYVDFLTKLYKYLEGLMKLHEGDWKDDVVEFLFSLPSTFNSPAISARFKEYIERAGFGKGGDKHSVEMSLTEPQAAAVCSVIESGRGFQPNEILLVVDAGGGTTDTCILEIAGTAAKPNFVELLAVEGINVGSTNIDYSFRALVNEKLQRIGMDISNGLSWEMVNTRYYEVQKCNFGQPAYYSPFLSVPVPDLSQDHTNRDFGIVDGRLLFSHDEFQKCFDPHILTIKEFIRTQLDSFQKLYPKKQINYLVLCGGLGSSAYVRDELAFSFTGEGCSTIHPQALNMEIRGLKDPQLAVMKGLVHDRIRRHNTGQPVLAKRRCRLSYGVLRSVPYDPAVHQGEVTFLDPFDGREYADNMIKWIIKKGDEIIPEKLISLGKWRSRYNPGEPLRVQKAQIVMADAYEIDLPTSLEGNGVEKLCQITYDFSEVEEEELELAYKPRHWNKLRRDPYYILEHNIKVLLGPADMRFQLWFKDKKYEAENESLALQWDEVTEPIEETNKKRVERQKRLERFNKEKGQVVITTSKRYIQI